MADNPIKAAVLVTGATGGIGTATVRALAERGVTVFATVHSDPGALAAIGGVHVIPMDVSDPASVALAAEQVGEELGDAGLRAIVNNAGVIVQGPLELIPPDELRRQFEINTFGPTYVAQAFLPLIRRGRGRIVNVSAPSAWVPLPFLAPIGASKAALESLSTALRTELAVWKIPVVLVEPGATRTLIFDKARAAARAALADAEPARVKLYEAHLAAVTAATAGQRFSPPEQVATAIVKAIEARRPRRWYPASVDVRLFRIASHLPARVREALIARLLGLRGVSAPA